MKCGIVCGYGTELDGDLKSYLTGVGRTLENKNIRLVVLSGGHTSGQKHLSEAAVMAAFLRKLKPDSMYIKEERSYTTLHNLLYAHEILMNQSRAVEELFIFCDKVRRLKVRLLSKIIFRSKVYIYSFHRDEPISTYLIQIPSTLNQLFGAILPFHARSIEELTKRSREALASEK